MYESRKVGITDARTSPTMLFWEKFFEILNIEPMVSDLSSVEAINKASKYMSNNEQSCLFRKIDFGQHIDLIEKGCNCLILPSTRTKNMLTCNSSRFMAEYISRYKKDIDVLNFRIHMDDYEMQKSELVKLAEYFTNDKEKINEIVLAWPNTFDEKNKFLNNNSCGKTNLLIIGRIYHYFDYRRSDSPYINILSKKLNCNILTLTDITNNSIRFYKDAYKKVIEYYPYWRDNVERYWNLTYIFRAIMAGKNSIDGIIFVKDPWCESAKEEATIIVDLINNMNIPYYLLDFNVESMSSIDTVLESFVEMLLLRRKKDASVGD